jgi:hypothetical protein
MATSQTVADRVIGKARVTVNGEVLRTEKGVSLVLAGDEIKEIEGDYEAGFTTEFKSAELTCKIMVKPGDSLERFVGMAGATVTVAFDTGLRYVLSDARQNSRPKITGKDGGAVDLKFTAHRCEEMLA